MTANSSDRPKKNALSIRLTESAVFLRTDGPSARPHRNAETRSSLVRGLLVLELAKPTKIASIELELVATASTAWPEGAGARRVEISEQHQAFQASILYFKANASTPSTRRTASIGPGTTLNYDDSETLDWDEDDIDNPLLRSPSTQQSLSQEGGAAFTHSNSVTPAMQQESPLFRPSGLIRAGRRVSADSHFHHPLPVSYREEEIPIPPYSPIDLGSPASLAYPQSPRSSVGHPTPESENVYPRSGPAQSLEEFRAELQSSLQSQRSPSRSSSLRPYTERSLSRRPSMGDVPEDAQLHPLSEGPPNVRVTSRSGSLTPSTTHSRSGSLSTPSTGPENRSYFSNVSNQNNEPATSIPQAPIHASASPSPSHRGSLVVPGGEEGAHHLGATLACGKRNASRQPSTSVERRGRNHSRFSLTAVADAFREAVRSTSPIATRLSRVSKERSEGSGELLGSRDRDAFIDDNMTRSRGRRLERSVAFLEDDAANATLPAGPSTIFHPPHHWRPESMIAATVDSRKSRSRPREPAARIFGPGFDETKEQKGTGNGWKEFKRGTFTYPISFSIPNTAPPTMQCDYGSVVWKLHAHVHRPGAFKTKYTASREVHVIACPTEEDTEDTENIIVERHWDQQLQYLISISGRSFHIGGTVPVTFAFMPLAKIKIYRLSMFIEERVDYYSNMRRVVRSDPITRFSLLTVKKNGKHPSHILPLDSNDTNALHHSPLYPLIDPQVDESEVASELMGPGPWSFHQELKLPVSCDAMRFSNKNRRANITVSHMLKVVIRVERGDDMFVDKAGKRKLFDIVIQTPVHILSCRCNPEWVSLPRYEEAFTSGDGYVIPNCPCQVRKMVAAGAQPTASQSSTSELHGGPFHAHLPTSLERLKHHAHTSDAHSDVAHAAAAAPTLGDSSVHLGGSNERGDTVQAVHQHETNPIDPNVMRSLRQVSTQNPQNAQMVRSSLQFERLVAGYESEFGDAPPAYNLVAPAGPSFSLRASA